MQKIELPYLILSELLFGIKGLSEQNVKVSRWSSQEFGCSFYLVLIFIHFFPSSHVELVRGSQ